MEFWTNQHILGGRVKIYIYARLKVGSIFFEYTMTVWFTQEQHRAARGLSVFLKVSTQRLNTRVGKRRCAQSTKTCSTWKRHFGQGKEIISWWFRQREASQESTSKTQKSLSIHGEMRDPHGKRWSAIATCSEHIKLCKICSADSKSDSTTQASINHKSDLQNKM